MSGTVGITLGIYLQPFKEGLDKAETLSAAALNKINLNARKAANEQSELFKQLGTSIGSKETYEKIAELQKKIVEGSRQSITAIEKMQTAGLTAEGVKAFRTQKEIAKNMSSGGFSYSEATQKATADFNRLNASVKYAAKGIQNSVNDVNFDPFKSTLYDVRNAILAALSIDKMGEFIETAIQFESVRASLKSMTGSILNAGVAFEYLKENSKDTGANILTSAKDFRLLVGAAAGADYSMTQLKETFSAVSTAAAVLGLKSEDTAGLMRAMGQIMSKGTVQAEELKGQIGDRLPGALGLAAKAMGVNNSQLLKMMENAELMSVEFIPKFTKALKEEYEKGLTDAQKTTLFATKQMVNAWDLFQDRFVNDTVISSAVKDLAQGITDLLDAMDSDSLSDFSTSLTFLGGQLRTVNDAVTDVASSLGKLAGIKAEASIVPLVVALGEAYIAFRLTRGIVTLLSTDLVVNLVKGLFASSAGMGAMSFSTMTLRGALLASAVSLKTFGLALKTAVPWLIAVTAAVSVGIWAYDSLTDSIDKAKTKMATLPEQLKKIKKEFNEVELGKGFNKLTDDIEISKKAIVSFQKKIKDIEAENKGGRSLWNILTNNDITEKKDAQRSMVKERQKINQHLTEQKAILTQIDAIQKAKEEAEKNKPKTPPKEDKLANKREDARKAIEKLEASLSSETKTGWDKTIGEIGEKVIKWTQAIDDAEKLLGKKAVAKVRGLVEDAKNALMTNAEQAYQANKDAFKTDFADDYTKAIQSITIKYANFNKSLKAGEKGEAKAWSDKAIAQALFNRDLKEANRIFTDREGHINTLENEAVKEEKLAQLTQDKINKEIELRNQYGQTNDKVIETLSAQKQAQEKLYNITAKNRARDNSLELLSYKQTRDEQYQYQKELYDKELQASLNVGFTKEQAEFIALQKSRTAWDTYVDDISYSYTNMMDGLQEVSKNAFSSMEDAFVEYMKTGKWSSKEFVDAIISDLMRMTVQMTITANLAKSLGMGTKAIGDWWSSSSSTQSAEATASAASTVPVMAKGGAYDGGIQRFAKGGTFTNSIVNKPTLFKFANGTGLMGEAGAEAIMPLTRDSSGKLGVSAKGTGGGVQNVKVEVINQSGTKVQANDVKISQSEQNGMIISIIVDDIRRGGAVAQAIRS